MQKGLLSKRLEFSLYSEYVIFLVSVVFSLRAISSMTIGLTLLTGMIAQKRRSNDLVRYKWSLLFLLGCTLLFIIQCTAQLYTKHITEGLKLLQRSSGLVATPLSIFMNRNFFTSERFRKLIFYFAAILCTAAAYCIGFALVQYSIGGSYEVFFYHALVMPISQHAIQFSIMVFCALVFLIEDRGEKKDPLFRLLQRPTIALLSIFLILLSSKLIITVYAVYLLYIFFNKQINKKRSRAFALCFIIFISGILLEPNPVGNRFRAIFSGNALLFEKKEFDQSTRFNGVQFRLLQWRFTYEILNEQHSWLSGLTPGDAQFLLDKKYIDAKMYTGVPGSVNRGFLGYHTHNQFLQTLLENGLPALAVFLFICFSLVKMAGNGQRQELKWLAALLLVYCLTDAPFETQYGLIIFTFLPMLFYSRYTPAESKQAGTAGNMALPQRDIPSTNFQRQPN